MLKLWTTIEKPEMSLLKDPMHPGDVLKELYLDPLEMSALALAKYLAVPRTRVERLVKGETRLTMDTALRLAKAFDTTPEYWINMQVNFDRAEAAKTVDLSEVRPVPMTQANT